MVTKQKIRDLPPDIKAHYRNHIVEFAYAMVYGILQRDGKYKTLTPEDFKLNIKGRRLEWQTIKILEAIQNNDYVTVHSGRGCTKTTALAIAAIWFLATTEEECRCIITGPKYDQLRMTIWAEINKWLSRSLLQDLIKQNSELMYHVNNPGKFFCRIMTSAEKENMAGVHARNVMWLVDEASNVEDVFIEAIMGGMNDPVSKLVMTGNPTKVTGLFYKSFTTEKDKWHVIHLSSEDSELKNPMWFDRMKKYPRESDMYRVNVLGLPPQGNPRSVMTLSDVMRAKDRYIRLPEPYLEMGVDPASEGNDLSAIAIRHGLKLLEVRTFSKLKAPELVIKIISILREWRDRLALKCKCRIKIDDHGIGAPIRQLLALNDTDNIEVVPVLFGGIKENKYYSDNITKMWFEFAEYLDVISLPNDEELIEELCSREWEPVEQSKQKVEPKWKFKKRLGHSPDRSDAVVMCFTEGTKKIFSRKQESEQNVEMFEIDWNLTRVNDKTFNGLIFAELVHVCAIVLNEDLSINGLAGCYQYYNNNLWIYGEFYHKYPISDIVVAKACELTHKGWFRDNREAKFIGNSKMFHHGDKQRPFGEMMRRDKLFINEPIHYDEYGAIGLGIKLLNNNKVRINKGCLRFREQFATWALKDSKPEINHGYCEALLLMLSELKDRIKPEQHIRPQNDYSPVFQRKELENSSSAWMQR